MGVAGEGVLCTTHVGGSARGHRSRTRGSHRCKSMKVFFVLGQCCVKKINMESVRILPHCHEGQHSFTQIATLVENHPLHFETAFLRFDNEGGWKIHHATRSEDFRKEVPDWKIRERQVKTATVRASCQMAEMFKEHALSSVKKSVLSCRGVDGFG